MRRAGAVRAAAVGGVLVATAVALAAGLEGAPVPITLPGGVGGIGFDDLGFASGLDRVLVPAGRTGNLDLIEPATGAVVPIGGFAAAGASGRGHGEGTTSADAGAGPLVFATDRTTRKLDLVDTSQGRIVASVGLAGGPDYVRWVEPTHEVWVTEPAAERIEVFVVGSAAGAAPAPAGFIQVKGGPESLVIDPRRGRAYTHLWRGKTVAVGLRSRTVEATWPNGCQQSQGIALDPERGWLFVACEDGKAVVLALASGQEGRVVSSIASGARGVDIISYDRSLRHLYYPGEESATMAVLGVGSSGHLSLLGQVPTAPGSHCVVADGRGGVWICDPVHGRLLRWEDRSISP